ncbi:MAG TPA: MarR family transcriptional regulator [Terracidiphilus sp.]|nr:MarR family transcriptional regulator [Terracidiphilus sp.]
MGRELSDAVVFFHEAVAAHVGMSVAEWKCLGILEQRGAMPASQLAALSGFTTGAITGIVDRLERAGRVRRTRHPVDRRSVIVEPLRIRQFRGRVEPIFRSLLKHLGVLAARFSAEDLAKISAFMSGMAAVLRAETAKLKSAPRQAPTSAKRAKR